jgi:hypothetical protein
MYLTRVHSGKPKLPSDRRRQVPVLVPPSWFRTTSTVFSACELRVCCTPQPVEGSPRFVLARRGSPEGGHDAGVSSRGAFRTLRRVPLVSSRKRITATVAFLSLPSCPVWERRPKPVTTPTAIPADAGGVRPRPAWGWATAPRRAGGRSQRTGRADSEEPGGRVRGQGRAGLRRAPSPSPTRWVHRSEERRGLPRRSGARVPGGGALAPKSRGFRTRGGGGGRGSEELRRRVPSGWVRWSEDRRVRLDGGVHSSGRGVPAGAGTGRGGSEESLRDARNNRGPGPKAGDGVRGRDPDAMMLRSAEADPHITEHTPRAEAEASVVVA